MRRSLAIAVASLLTIGQFSGGAFAAQKPGRDGDITVVQALDMISFDPIATSDLNNQYVLYNLYSRLFTFPRNRLSGDVKELCKDFKRVSNTEWHFTIWDNVKYHDGSTLTVDDVVYSLNRAKAGTALGALFKPVKEIKKVDNKTLSITTDGPYPAMTSALTHAATCIVPKSFAEKAEKSKDWSKPIGSGRYKFVSRMIGDSVVFERFDGYFNKNELAQNKTLTIKVIPEGTNRTIAIETGAADLNAEFTPTDYARVMKNPKLKLWDQPSALVWHLGMDNTQGWFKNKLVRQAVAFAVDHEGTMKVGHDGRGVVLYNSATFAHAPTVLGAIQNPLNKYSYNVQKAKALMKEANCPGFTTQLVVFRDEAERILLERRRRIRPQHAAGQMLYHRAPAIHDLHGRVALSLGTECDFVPILPCLMKNGTLREFEHGLTRIRAPAGVWRRFPGVRQAARVYFGKELRHLLPIESAYLAALTPNPHVLARRFRDGHVDDGWLQRLHDLLAMMRRSGRLTAEELSASRGSKPALRKLDKEPRPAL